MAKILLRMAQARTNQGDDDQALALLEAEGSGRSLTVAYLNLGNASGARATATRRLAFYEKALPLQAATTAGP